MPILLPMFTVVPLEKVAVLSSTLSWVVLSGNVLVCLLFLWGSLHTTTSRRWSSVASYGGMLLLALLSYLAYLVVTLHGWANFQFFLTLLPLTSSVLLAGMYILTAPHLSLKPRQRVALMSLIIVVSLSLFSVFLLGLGTA